MAPYGCGGPGAAGAGGAGVAGGWWGRGGGKGRKGGGREERRQEGGRFHSRLTCSHLHNTFSRGVARGSEGGGSGGSGAEAGGEAPKVCQKGPNYKFSRASRDYNLRDHTKFADRSIKTRIFFALRAILSLRTLLKTCIRDQVTNSMAKFVHNRKRVPLANFLEPPPAVKWEKVDRTFELKPLTKIRVAFSVCDITKSSRKQIESKE